MICKLICRGRNRVEAIQRMNRSLDEFVIEGITTTIPLHKKLLSHKKFIDSDFNVSWLDKEKIIRDFIFICYFLGNDFLPHIPSIDIKSSASHVSEITNDTFCLPIDEKLDEEKEVI